MDVEGDDVNVHFYMPNKYEALRPAQKRVLRKKRAAEKECKAKLAKSKAGSSNKTTSEQVATAQSDEIKTLKKQIAMLEARLAKHEKQAIGNDASESPDDNDSAANLVTSNKGHPALKRQVKCMKE